jgi:hypothetical protein
MHPSDEFQDRLNLLKVLHINDGIHRSADNRDHSSTVEHSHAPLNNLQLHVDYHEIENNDNNIQSYMKRIDQVG